MDKGYEEMIVKTFFNKAIQNRVIFELLTQKKRKDGLSRFNNNKSKNGICEAYKMKLEKPNSNFIEILDLLKKYGAGDTCYVISFNEDIDGKHLPLSYALEKAVSFGMPSLILCIPNKLAYLECEQEYGPPPRYILRKD